MISLAPSLAFQLPESPMISQAFACLACSARLRASSTRFHAFREDDCRVRTSYAAENFAVIRHIAVNLLKGVTGLNGKKLGVKNKRLLAGWHDGYLLRVLGVIS